jgi:nuclear protein localization family protein 4
MLLRVRSNVGVWRVDKLDEQTATVSAVIDSIRSTRPHLVYLQALSSDPACMQPLDARKTLKAQGITHGSMVYCRVDPETCVDNTRTSAPIDVDGDGASSVLATASPVASNMRRVIDKDGRIIMVPSNEAPSEKDRGFRKGMMPLRDMKMQWTMNDFMALDSQFEFKIQRQESAICKQASLEMPSLTNFQGYLQNFQFQRKHVGLLYGTFVSEDPEVETPNKVRVEAIYEPPQGYDSASAEGVNLLDDPKEETVEKIAAMLGWRRVGWIFGQDQVREEGFVLSASEIIMAAEYQLEAADGVNETPFVTIKVAKGQDGSVAVEAFQVSQQCMTMVAEQALQIGPDPKCCVINETFTAIQEGKPSPTVDNNFFVTVVPIVQHTSEHYISDFPRVNRDIDTRHPSHDEMKKTLSKSGSSGWTFVDRLADFNLLIYLSDFFDINGDMPKIAASIVDRSKPLDDGYKLIIKSLAGMEGSY